LPPAQEIDPDPYFWLEAGAYLPAADPEISLFKPDRSRATLILLADELGFETDASSIVVKLGAKIDYSFDGLCLFLRQRSGDMP
jgi:hypothetical protein